MPRNFKKSATRLVVDLNSQEAPGGGNIRRGNGPLREALACVHSAQRNFAECQIEDFPASPIQPRQQPVVQDNRRKAIVISGKSHTLDPKQLCRIIMHTTQQIGEYKAMNNPYSAYVVNALRKARNDMVSDLEVNFNIGHRIGDNGKSIFYYL
jgi:hypothetical protein